MPTTSKPGAPPAPAPPTPRARLSKEERRELLARIERESSRAESPERILQRAEQAFQNGNRGQAERLVVQLEKKSPNLLGLDHLRARLGEAGKREKMKANVGKAEEMLMRYIEQRKKVAAEFALEALAEIAPDHPRLGEYRIWVRDLDQEAAAQKQLSEELAAGRAALRSGELAAAQQHLDKLRDLDLTAPATSQLAADILHAEAGEAESADIESIKRRFEERLAARRLAEAERELTQLAHHTVPKITLDRLHVRLQEAREVERVEQEIAAFEKIFRQHLEAGQWQQARDAAQRAGGRFPNHPHPAEMFNEVNLREAEQQRRESIRQGVATLKQFIGEGRRDEAQLALKLLQGKIDAQQLARFEERVKAL